MCKVVNQMTWSMTDPDELAYVAASLVDQDEEFGRLNGLVD